MRLVEIAGLVNDIENRHPTAQQLGRESRALDLPQEPVCHPGGLQEVALHRAQCQRLGIAGERGAHGGVIGYESALYQAFDETLGILVSWDFPGGAVEPEAFGAEEWQVHAVVVE